MRNQHDQHIRTAGRGQRGTLIALAAKFVGSHWPWRGRLRKGGTTSPDKRWSVEVNLRHLEQTLHVDALRCESWQGVWKELLVFVQMYNLMVKAGRQQVVEPERISFVDASRWLREARPGEVLPPLPVFPCRPGRMEPRVQKRRPKPYDLMNKPRSVAR